MLDRFELGHNAVEATENICCAKDEGAVILLYCNQMVEISDEL